MFIFKSTLHLFYFYHSTTYEELIATIRYAQVYHRKHHNSLKRWNPSSVCIGIGIGFVFSLKAFQIEAWTNERHRVSYTCPWVSYNYPEFPTAIRSIRNFPPSRLFHPPLRKQATNTGFNHVFLIYAGKSLIRVSFWARDWYLRENINDLSLNPQLSV